MGTFDAYKNANKMYKVDSNFREKKHFRTLHIPGALGGTPPTIVDPKITSEPENGPSKIYKPYLEHFSLFKTPVWRSEGVGG